MLKMPSAGMNTRPVTFVPVIHRVIDEVLYQPTPDLR